MDKISAENNEVEKEIVNKEECSEENTKMEPLLNKEKEQDQQLSIPQGRRKSVITLEQEIKLWEENLKNMLLEALAVLQ